MNKMRLIISDLFASPMQDMSYVAYFNYVNTAGKVTARSIMDLCTVLLTFADEQEKKNDIYEAQFKEIEEILSKLVDTKTASYAELVPGKDEFLVIQEKLDMLTCDVCGKEAKSAFGLQAHKRSHLKDEKVL